MRENDGSPSWSSDSHGVGATSLHQVCDYLPVNSNSKWLFDSRRSNYNLKVRTSLSKLGVIVSQGKSDPLWDEPVELTAVRKFFFSAITPALSACSSLGFCSIHLVSFGSRHFRFPCKIPAPDVSGVAIGATRCDTRFAPLCQQNNTRRDRVAPVSLHRLGIATLRTRIEPCNHGVSPSSFKRGEQNDTLRRQNHVPVPQIPPGLVYVLEGRRGTRARVVTATMAAVFVNHRV